MDQGGKGGGVPEPLGWSWWVTWGMLGVIRMLGGEGWRVLRGTVEMLGALEVLLGGGMLGAV